MQSAMLPAAVGSPCPSHSIVCIQHTVYACVCLYVCVCAKVQGVSLVLKSYIYHSRSKLHRGWFSKISCWFPFSFKVCLIYTYILSRGGWSGWKIICYTSRVESRPKSWCLVYWHFLGFALSFCCLCLRCLNNFEVCLQLSQQLTHKLWTPHGIVKKNYEKKWKKNQNFSK